MCVGTVLLKFYTARPSNLTGHNGRTMACVYLRCTLNVVVGVCIHVPLFVIDMCVVFFNTPEIEQELE